MTESRQTPGQLQQQEAKVAREVVFTPAQAAKLYVEYSEFLGKNPGLGFGIHSVDRDLHAMRPGDVVGMIARPGGGKSTMLAYLARHHGRRIASEGKSEKECVVYISLEQAVEELEVLFQAAPGHTVSEFLKGKIPQEQVLGLSLSRPTLPIWTIGRSILERRSIPRLTVETLYQALRGIRTEFGIRPRLILLDYIQIVPIERIAERFTQVSEAINGSKELAQTIGCPIVMGVQASRRADERDDKIPTLEDCQWSSALEQVGDKLFGLARPWLSKAMRRSGLEWEGAKLPVTEDMLMVRKQKERFNRAGNSYLLSMEPDLIHLCDRELEISDRDAQRMEAERRLNLGLL